MSLLLIGPKNDLLLSAFSQFCAAHEIEHHCIDSNSSPEAYFSYERNGSNPRFGLLLDNGYLLTEEDITAIWWNGYTLNYSTGEHSDNAYLQEENFAFWTGFLGHFSRPVLNRPRPTGLRPSSQENLLLRRKMQPLLGAKAPRDIISSNNFPKYDSSNVTKISLTTDNGISDGSIARPQHFFFEPTKNISAYLYTGSSGLFFSFENEIFCPFEPHVDQIVFQHISTIQDSLREEFGVIYFEYENQFSFLGHSNGVTPHQIQLVQELIFKHILDYLNNKQAHQTSDNFTICEALG
jgi:hypothetical protein